VLAKHQVSSLAPSGNHFTSNKQMRRRHYAVKPQPPAISEFLTSSICEKFCLQEVCPTPIFTANTASNRL